MSAGPGTQRRHTCRTRSGERNGTVACATQLCSTRSVTTAKFVEDFVRQATRRTYKNGKCGTPPEVDQRTRRQFVSSTPGNATALTNVVPFMYQTTFAPVDFCQTRSVLPSPSTSTAPTMRQALSVTGWSATAFNNVAPLMNQITLLPFAAFRQTRSVWPSPLNSPAATSCQFVSATGGNVTVLPMAAPFMYQAMSAPVA